MTSAPERGGGVQKSADFADKQYYKNANKVEGVKNTENYVDVLYEWPRRGGRGEA